MLEVSGCDKNVHDRFYLLKRPLQRFGTMPACEDASNVTTLLSANYNDQYVMHARAHM